MRIAQLTFGALAIVGCGKQAEPPGTGSPTPSGASASAVPAPSANSTSGPAATVGSGSAQVAAASGAGSATESGTPSTASSGSSIEDFYQSDLCHAVAEQTKRCLADPAFITALDEGATPAKKRLHAKLRKQVRNEWPDDARDICGTYFQFTFKYEGFLDHPEKLTTQIAASCATLGAALRDAGGLPGGQVAK